MKINSLNTNYRNACVYLDDGVGIEFGELGFWNRNDDYTRWEIIQCGVAYVKIVHKSSWWIIEAAHSYGLLKHKDFVDWKITKIAILLLWSYEGNKVICKISYSSLLGVVSVGSYISWLSWVDWLRELDRREDKVARWLDKFFDGVIEEHINKKVNKNLDDRKWLRQSSSWYLTWSSKKNTINFKFERDTIKAVIWWNLSYLISLLDGRD